MGRHIDEAAIRERAYFIWEREGRPHGAEFDHWYRATLELMGEVEAARQAGAEVDIPLPEQNEARPGRPATKKSPPASGRKPKRATRTKR